VIAAGESLLAPSVTRRLIETFRRQRPHTPQPPPQLAERELEVLGLIARGLSNAEIAGELFVSSTTVKTHVAHVLSKLDLRDRVQAVVLALRNRDRPPGRDTTNRAIDREPGPAMCGNVTLPVRFIVARKSRTPCINRAFRRWAMQARTCDPQLVELGALTSTTRLRGRLGHDLGHAYGRCAAPRRVRVPNPPSLEHVRFREVPSPRACKSRARYSSRAVVDHRDKRRPRA
jgi:DNA-binding CsgD family transcriptional regulator